MVTKANMATHVDGNILEMSFHLTKRSFPNWQIYGSFSLSKPAYIWLEVKALFCFFSALDMKQELNTKASQLQLFW